ncbi:hypothetical protein AB0K51_23920 [Kitasatospora sp. NPDC049285]|uniref:hypothetical protein n=1 Tax=Kitasatospora sp. NPDC049285 TaxID=3157096 RepID=UPI00343DC427
MADSYEERRFSEFLGDGERRVLPARRVDASETWETYRLLGIDVTRSAGDYVEVTWPDGWRKVRAGETEWQFELRDAADTPMVIGTVLEHPDYRQSVIDMRLTHPARRIVRRRYQAMPTWQQHLIKVKGTAAWRPLYPSMRRSKPFDSYERTVLPIMVARLRALGWTIGEQLPTGVEILLSDEAAGWEEERDAGDRFWVLPSSGGPTLAYGVAAGGEYPWCQWDLQTSIGGSADEKAAGPSAIATEVDQVLRRGLPPNAKTWPVLGHPEVPRRTREEPSRPAGAAEAAEIPVRDSLTLWDQPLVDPRRVWWQHRLVLESHPDLPPPSAKRQLVPFSKQRHSPGLRQLAERYRGLYFLPRSLPEEYQEVLRQARAAARAVKDAPAKIAEELVHRVDQLSDGDLLLDERLLELARSLERTAATEGPLPDVDANWPLLRVLEACAGESFDLALRQAETVQAIIAYELNLPLQEAVTDRDSRVSYRSVTEHVVCDCGKSRWLLVFVGGHGAIGCACGRLRWESRLRCDVFERSHPGKLTEFQPPFDLDAIAAEVGFGPFRHKW